jgi:SAM-dependent methyltransferase
MASSFANQIPIIIYLIQQYRPSSILDIGKGFGKYGFLIHEFTGIDNTKRPKPELTLAQQSSTAIDAIDVNPEYSWPHIEQLYRNLKIGRIEELYLELPHYDLILMADIIEHLDKAVALKIVQHFVESGSIVVISTPVEFFRQDLYESDAEHHVSHWTAADFKLPGIYMERQNIYPGRVFVVANRPLSIRGFGRGGLKTARRIARCLANELDNIFGRD